MMKTRIMLAAATTFVVAVSVALIAVVRMIACTACAQWQALLTLSLVALVAVAVAVGAATVLISVFRQEVRKRDQAQERYADRGAPPWAQQYDPPSSNLSMRSRPGSLRPEWVNRAACGVFGVIALVYAISSPPETRTLVGKPIEVRSYSRTVVMPGEGEFRYDCRKSEGRRLNGTCPADARWYSLPRWHHPEVVRMEVEGTRIRRLEVDGVLIVDPTESRTARFLYRLGALFLGLACLAFVARPLFARARDRLSAAWRCPKRRRA